MQEYRKIDAQDILSVMRIAIPAGACSHGSFDMQCPFCDDKKKHMNIDLIGARFRCNRCQEGGSLFQFYGRLHTPPIYDKDEIKKELRRVIDGSDYTMQAQIKKEIVKDTKSPTASPEVRDVVYTAMLSMCTLRQEHKKDLLKRGLTEAAIKANNYKSTMQTKNRERITEKILEQCKGVSVEGVPGFYLGENGKWTFKYQTPGYFIPFRDMEGKISGLQIRVDDKVRREMEKKGEDIGKYIWYTSTKLRQGETKGARGDAAVHHTLRHPTKQVLITEGGLKADVATHLLRGSQMVLGVAGVSSVRRLPEAVTECINGGTTTFIIAMDMDMYTEEHVYKSTRKIVEIVRAIIKEKKSDAKIMMLQWEKEKGIDDFLLTQTASDLNYRIVPPIF